MSLRRERQELKRKIGDGGNERSVLSGGCLENSLQMRNDRHVSKRGRRFCNSLSISIFTVDAQHRYVSC